MIDWNKYFDHVFIISRCKNFEKQQIMDQNLKNLELTDYQYWWVPDYSFNNSLIFKENDLNLNHARCSFGHYSLWKMCYERELKNVLIIEDDLCFLKDTNTIKEMLELYYSKRDNIDIYLFDYNYSFSITLEENNNYIYLPSYILGTCYSLTNSNSFEYLINLHEKTYLVCDNYFIDYTNILNDNYISIEYMHMLNTKKSKSVIIDKFIKLDISPIRIGIQPDKIYKDIEDKNIYNI